MNLAVVVLRFAYVGTNNRRDQQDETEIREKYTDEQLLDIGDKNPLYRYVV